MIRVFVATLVSSRSSILRKLRNGVDIHSNALRMGLGAPTEIVTSYKSVNAMIVSGR